MVDFKKRLAARAADRPTHPVEIYTRLDRASDKGPLRPAQKSVLDTWYAERRKDRDVVLKLHTGEGKTLIGLLMLQATLNELHERRAHAKGGRGIDGRALYLCPNHFLVSQTLSQAKQFGVSCVPVDEDGGLPAAFLDGKAILVAPVQKLFNGLSKFGLGAQSERVDALVLDDAHACIDAIKDACMLTLPREHQGYQDLLSLFDSDLEEQGVGRYAEIRARDAASFIPVPYWSWMDRHRDVAGILAKHATTREARFVWPLLRDMLRDCLCVISGRELIIAPYRAPLEQFGTFANASHRVFMSATISDDSFLVRGLGLKPKVVCEPLTHNGSAWSGEKMVLIPSDIDDSLTRTEIVHRFSKTQPKRSFGVVTLVPSFEAAKIWSSEGAVVARAGDIDAHVEGLRNGDRAEALVVANRYDGIDLPDDSCRILILDGRPFGESLIDRYNESCRPGSDVIAMRVARVIEQGMGRAVRGEKDYCAILLIGSDLVRTVRTREGRMHFSPQTQAQLTIGLTISGWAREELVASAGEKTAAGVLTGMLRQLLSRDDGWKDYYTEQMGELAAASSPASLVDVFAEELEAELLYEAGDVDGAVATLQRLLDGRAWDAADRGWYLQEMARYRYPTNRVEALTLQAAAHRQNRYLLRPKEGVTVTRLEPVSQRRAARILDWVRQHSDFSSLSAVVDDLVGTLRFGIRAEPFETAIHDLGIALGFASERPDKEWKAGPDNLWALRDGEYLLVECKSEVETTRVEINKHETGQMNNASAWFAREYPGASVTRVMVTPARKVSAAAGFNEPVVLLRARNLRILARNVRSFFGEFRAFDLRDISENKVQQLLQQHHLRTKDLQTFYYEQPKEP